MSESHETLPKSSETGVIQIQNGFDSQNIEKYVEDGKNKFTLRCPRCSSKILEKHSGFFVIVEKMLPHVYVSTDKTVDVPREIVKEYYYVENMYTFDNIGFTYEVDNLKYLSCADCETGPLGYFEINTAKSYLALSRVTHT